MDNKVGDQLLTTQKAAALFKQLKMVVDELKGIRSPTIHG